MHAIVRADVLRVTLPHVAVNRGAVAGSALATLFIVASIGQNFFSAEYGLVTGGIVAGAFLFAAQPLQRAMERLGAPAPAPGRFWDEGNERIYRDALRVALRDRVLTREEEVSLHRVAEGLGIGAGRAHAILLEVEREMGVA